MKTKLPDAFVAHATALHIAKLCEDLSDIENKARQTRERIGGIRSGFFKAPMPIYYDKNGVLTAMLGEDISTVKQALWVLACFTGERQEVAFNDARIRADPASKEPT
jgi:hypothetical protein